MKPLIEILVGDLEKYSPSWLLGDQAEQLLSSRAKCKKIVPDLPLFSTEYEQEGQEPLPSAVEDFRSRLRQADAMLLCTPEYNGLPSPVVLNALLWASREPLAPLCGLPTMVAGASRGLGGTRKSRPVLREVLHETGIEPLEEDIFVACVDDTFSSDEALRQLQTELGEKLSGLLLAARRRQMSVLER